MHSPLRAHDEQARTARARVTPEAEFDRRAVGRCWGRARLSFGETVILLTLSLSITKLIHPLKVSWGRGAGGRGPHNDSLVNCHR